MASPRAVPGRREVVGLLSDVLPADSDRFAHTITVGRKAERVAVPLGASEPELVVAAAFLHDIGYADAAVDTGMHQLDGARFLRSLGYDDDLCRLVAHHSFARAEARHRGLADVLMAEFVPPDGGLSESLDLVTYCDLTTSSTGEPVSVYERLSGIYARYPSDHVVTVTMREVEAPAHEVVARIQALVDALAG
jgi:putative nucleotidyltransferase with HDIG domain